MPGITELPQEVKALIGEYLPTPDCAQLSATSWHFFPALQDMFGRTFDTRLRSALDQPYSRVRAAALAGLGWVCDTFLLPHQAFTRRAALGGAINLPREDGVVPLYAAIQAQQPNLVRRLLIHGGSPSAVGPRGRPLLHEAVARGHPGNVEQLLAAGALVSAQAENGVTALHEAAKGSPDLVPLLLTRGALTSIEDAWSQTPLDVSALRGDTASLKHLLGAGASVTSLALNIAAEEGHLEVVKQLLEHVARTGTEGAVARVAPIALNAAANRGQCQIVEHLLDAGVPVDAKGEDEGMFPALYGAVAWEHRDVVGLLLRRGAQVCGEYPYGRTLLHIAARNGNAYIVDLLLTAGAPPTETDSRGQTAEQLAIAGGHTEIAERLMAARVQEGAPHVSDAPGSRTPVPPPRGPER